MRSSLSSRLNSLFLSEPSSFDVRAKYVAGEQKPALDPFVVSFEIAIFMLDDDRPVIPGAIKRCEGGAPVDLAETGHARDLPADAGREDPAFIEPVTFG